MKPNSQLNEFKRVMNCVDVENTVKQRIIKNCARYSTMKKLRSGKYRIIAVKKEKTSNNI